MADGGGETRDNPSGWTVDTLKTYFQAQIDQLQFMLEERYTTQSKAIDSAAESQLRAMTTALTAAETAVQAALASAEKAVIKAEIASDKRFESVNEFRAQLSDQALTFMPRREAEAAVGRNTERLEDLNRALIALLPRAEYNALHEALVIRVEDLTNRLNRSEGSIGGVTEKRTQVIAFISATAAVIAILITIYVAIKTS